MARRVRLETDLGKVRPHTLAVFEEFAERFDIHFAWGIGPTGDHKAGKALDLMAYERGGGPSNPGRIRPGWNKTVADYAWANQDRLGIDYVIYDQVGQSNNPGGSLYGGWKHYTGESHANHVHISFEETPPAYRPPTGGTPPQKGDDMQLSDQMDVPQWLIDRFPHDKGIADGQMSLQTAWASGYAHARTARQEIATLDAYVHDAYADLLTNLKQTQDMVRRLETLIVGDDEPPPQQPIPTDVHYTVAAGDTLTGIARRFDTTVDAIAERNNLSDPGRIFPGQVLVIPGTNPAEETDG